MAAVKCSDECAIVMLNVLRPMLEAALSQSTLRLTPPFVVPATAAFTPGFGRNDMFCAKHARLFVTGYDHTHDTGCSDVPPLGLVSLGRWSCLPLRRPCPTTVVIFLV